VLWINAHPNMRQVEVRAPVPRFAFQAAPTLYQGSEEKVGKGSAHPPQVRRPALRATGRLWDDGEANGHHRNV